MADGEILIKFADSSEIEVHSNRNESVVLLVDADGKAYSNGKFIRHNSK